MIVLFFMLGLTSAQSTVDPAQCGLSEEAAQIFDRMEVIIQQKYDLVVELVDTSREDITKELAKAYQQGQLYNFFFLAAWVIEIYGDWIDNDRSFQTFENGGDVLVSYGQTFTLGIADQASAIFGGLVDPADTRTCFLVPNLVELINDFGSLEIGTCAKSLDGRMVEFEMLLRTKMNCLLSSTEDTAAELEWTLGDLLTALSLRNQILDSSTPS